MDVVEPAVVMTEASPQRAQAEAPPAAATLRQKLEMFSLQSAVAVAGLLPTRWVTGIGATLVGVVGPRLRQHRRALANLEIAFPDKSLAERQAIARRMWANMGRTFAEMLILPRITADPDAVTLVDEPHWRTRMQDAAPLVCCTLHMGSWELAVLPINRGGRLSAGVYRPLGNPLIDRWLVASRAPLYPGGLLGKGDTDDDVRSGQRTARRLIDLARKGGMICFVCDHYERRGDPISFMGRQAKFTIIPALISRHVGARVFVGACLRIGTSSRFRMEIRELEVPRSNDRAADARALTTAIFAVFESWIRAHPEQWMWWNTRWVKAE